MFENDVASLSSIVKLNQIKTLSERINDRIMNENKNENEMDEWRMDEGWPWRMRWGWMKYRWKINEGWFKDS